MLSKHFTAGFDGVHGFGYNNAESEPIWMKSGALGGWPWQTLGAIRALATSESWRAKRHFIFVR